MWLKFLKEFHQHLFDLFDGTCCTLSLDDFFSTTDFLFSNIPFKRTYRGFRSHISQEIALGLLPKGSDRKHRNTNINMRLGNDLFSSIISFSTRLRTLWGIVQCRFTKHFSNYSTEYPQGFLFRKFSCQNSPNNTYKKSFEKPSKQRLKPSSKVYRTFFRIFSRIIRNGRKFYYKGSTYSQKCQKFIFTQKKRRTKKQTATKH